MTVHYDVLFERQTVKDMSDFLEMRVVLPQFKKRETDWNITPKKTIN
jgi:hypothetical protein